MTTIVFASNNRAKLSRMLKLLNAAGFNVNLRTPKEMGIENFDVTEDGKSLKENAEKKANELAKLTSYAILADDTGFFIEGAKIDPVMVKRNALNGIDEKSLTVEEIGMRMSEYYQNIASARGGKIDADWRNGMYLLTPERKGFYVEAVRPSILTNVPHGKMDPYFPLRPLYMSKITGKYVLEQSESEEMLELSPITEGLRKLLGNWKGF